LRWDRALFEQALVCLLDNAEKYSTGSAVLVRLHLSGRLEVSVANQAPPMDPAELERIMEWSVRGKRGLEVGSEGSGIGLPLARELIRAHGGDLAVDYVSGCFHASLWLPGPTAPDFGKDSS
jgi:signal transduction histidine kinase